MQPCKLCIGLTLYGLEAVTIKIINALVEVLRKSVQSIGTDWVGQRSKEALCSLNNYTFTYLL